MTFTRLHPGTRRSARGRTRGWRTRSAAWRARRSSWRERPRADAAASTDRSALAPERAPAEPPLGAPLAETNGTRSLEPARRDIAAARVREAGGPIDEASYTCGCGYVFLARVSTTVSCPHCGAGQAW